MKMKKFGATEKMIYDLVEPVITQRGYILWDVVFEKEGAYWYLRIFVDRSEEITIEDCEDLTRPVNDLLDKVDPISQSYILEVGSAGLERDLNQPWHFTKSLGMLVRARATRPVDGVREWIGVLTDFKDPEMEITLDLQDGSGEVTLHLADMAYVHRYIEVEF